MNSTASEWRSKPAPAARSQSRLRPPIVSHVLTAVEIEYPRLLSMTRLAANLIIEPRALLALLVYHYAQRVLASQEIESAFRADPHLRLLCRDEFPDWRELRRFRRLNRSAVCSCLAHVLAEENSPNSRPPSPSDEAEERVSEAAFLDTMFADE